jgi:hypothetical protein
MDEKKTICILDDPFREVNTTKLFVYRRSYAEQKSKLDTLPRINLLCSKIHHLPTIYFVQKYG